MPVFYQDPKIERGVANIITADSVDELPTDAPDGTIALVSSGGVIDLDAWGIDIVSLANSGGGEASFSIDHQAFWSSIPVNGQFRIKANSGTNKFMIQPLSMCISDEGVIYSIDLVLLVVGNGYVTRVSAKLKANGNAGTDGNAVYTNTSVTAVVEPLTIPTA